MTPNPKVSIIIPVYNGSDYLREAIDSALRQTYQNIEVIVVNDGSDDGGRTEAIAKSYGDKIRYFHKEKGGVSTALNFGIMKMKGEWFAWLSHDDLFSSNRIEEDMRLIKNDHHARAIFCKISVISARGEIIEDVTYPVEKVTNPREALQLGGVDMCAMTIHKSCFDRTGLFNEFNRTTQDVEMTLRLSNMFPFYFNSNTRTYKRDHQNRGTHTLSEQRDKDCLLLCDFIHDELSLLDFFPDLSNDEDKIANAWIWMGHLYFNFGASHYADECYKCALATQKNVFRRWLKAFRIIAKKLNKPILKKMINYLYCHKGRIMRT